ncbi:disulfide bond formation protein B [Microvirga sp. 17 mud 1-3]|uniref:disulfide bond formation protein B n=1 Tax=Microvirga sp. 17 mud 1-3 TaxID=2082949 RepID=UPI000D6BA786|nr:disulfide bond formation protein B [Microvirga sp. 17 mud 1-3]AWM85344.1 disulfide bond formation protein B [Microvirga sp. 17 mud 1-3]
MLTPRLAMTLNALGLYAIAAILAVAFAMQFWLHELPCPLCLLQRVAFAALAVGPILNLRFGPRPSHYALSLLAALLGAGIAMRQILLHIMPGDPGYGSALLGLHYYSWAFVCFAAALLLTAAMLLSDRQFKETIETPRLGAFGTTAVFLVIALTLANVAGTFVECGPNVCPDDPVSYRLLSP